MDLSTKYMGMTLKHPVVPSASPLSRTLDGIRSLEDAGAAAITMYSLFEEQIMGESHLVDHYLTYGTHSFAEAIDYFPEMDSYNVGPEAYLNLISQAKAAVDIPIIGSLNGVSTGGWIEYAKRIQEAGADALELNIYYIPTDPAMSGAEVEKMYLDDVRMVKGSRSTFPWPSRSAPTSAPLPTWPPSLPMPGADALVVFNRFYQPDFDLERLEVTPNLVFSTSVAMRLALRWVAILYGKVPVDFAITNGVHTYEDVLKGLMAGASIMTMASELLEERHRTHRRDCRRNEPVAGRA